MLQLQIIRKIGKDLRCCNYAEREKGRYFTVLQLRGTRKGHYFTMLQLRRMGKRLLFYGVAATRNRVNGGILRFCGYIKTKKYAKYYSIVAATNLFKEFSSDAGSYRRMALVDRPNNDHCSLGASLHILF